MGQNMVPHSGNSAVSHVAHATNEVIAIYPITPSSDMGEIADAKSARGEKNIWGTVPHVVELQSEGGAQAASTPSPSQSPMHSGTSVPPDNSHRYAGWQAPSG